MLKKEYESMIYNNLCTFGDRYQFVDPALFRSFVQVSAAEPSFAEEGTNEAFLAQCEFLEKNIYNISLDENLNVKSRQDLIKKAYEPLNQSLREVFVDGDNSPFVPLKEEVWLKILNDPYYSYIQSQTGIDFASLYEDNSHYQSSMSPSSQPRGIELSKDSFSEVISRNVSPNDGIDVSKQTESDVSSIAPRGQDIIQAWRKRLEVLDKKRNKRPMNKKTQETLDSLRKVHGAESFNRILSNAQMSQDDSPSVENSSRKWVENSQSSAPQKRDEQLSK